MIQPSTYKISDVLRKPECIVYQVSSQWRGFKSWSFYTEEYTSTENRKHSTKSNWEPESSDIAMVKQTELLWAWATRQN